MLLGFIGLNWFGLVWQSVVLDHECWVVDPYVHGDFVVDVECWVGTASLLLYILPTYCVLSYALTDLCQILRYRILSANLLPANPPSSALTIYRIFSTYLPEPD